MDYPDKIELVLTYKHDPNDTEIFTEKVDLVISIPPQLQYQPIRSFLLHEQSIENIDFRDCLSKVHASHLE